MRRPSSPRALPLGSARIALESSSRKFLVHIRGDLGRGDALPAFRSGHLQLRGHWVRIVVQFQVEVGDELGQFLLSI